MNLSWSKGCRGIFKKLSCKSVTIMCQFWEIVVGDGIPGCNVFIGFIDALTFLRSVKRHHLLDFFFITKIEFQGEQDSSICFNSNCVSISSLVACNSFVRGHCSVQIGSLFFQVILIIACLLNEQWPLGKMWNVYLSLPLHK